MPPAGVSFEHEDRLRSRSDIRSEPDAADGLHHRPTRTVAVDLDRLAVDASETDAGVALDTAELEQAPPARRRERPRPADPRFAQRVPARSRTTSPQPSPNPIAAEVAERYAKALTLGAAGPTLPEPPAPRRSQAAMRDRALDPPGRSSSRRRARSASPAGERPARPAAPAPARVARPARPRSAKPADAEHATALALRIPASDDPVPTGGRRTVTIRGRGAERDYGWSYESSRRPGVPAHERPGFKPDRAALWAVFLGLLLVLVAATSAHAAVLAHAVP
jgi:hypothetical protein